MDQIFSVTCDNGANMLATVKQLQQDFDFLVLQQLEKDNSSDGTAIDSEVDDEFETENGEFSHANELSEALSFEFQDQLNLVRCSVHTLQLAILDVVNKKDESIRQITTVAKKCKGVKYKTHFDYHSATLPPV